MKKVGQIFGKIKYEILIVLVVYLLELGSGYLNTGQLQFLQAAKLSLIYLAIPFVLVLLWYCPTWYRKLKKHFMK